MKILHDLTFRQAVVLSKHETKSITVIKNEANKIQWVIEEEGMTRPIAEAVLSEKKEMIPSINIPDFTSYKKIEGKAIYHKKAGVYDKELQCISHVYQKEKEAWGILNYVEDPGVKDAPGFSPVLLDAALLCRLAFDSLPNEDAGIPFYIETVICADPLKIPRYCQIQEEVSGCGMWEGSVYLYTEKGELVIGMEHVVCKSGADLQIAADINLPEEDDIAVIGMAGHFPGASNVNEFWENLMSGRELIARVPWDRLNIGEKSRKEAENIPNLVGGFIKDIEEFDAEYFQISNREKASMDPQQKIMLKTALETLHDAGYEPDELAGSTTGVFIGAAAHDFYHVAKEQNKKNEAQFLMGNAHNILSGRIAGFFDFHGPCEAVDTACASSLTAVAHAFAAIKSGQCEQALAGGVQIILDPFMQQAFDRLGILSRNGICRTFDKHADGTVRGEGAGLILLKRKKAAIADGNHIYGILRGLGVSHNGKASSMTAPSPLWQAEAVIEAFRQANISPSSVNYIEAHGTGTILGDPIEVEALKKAFERLDGKERIKAHTCGLSAVKPQIGHLETASGIAAIIKVLLAMKHRKIPGIVNFQELNPYIQLEESPFYIVEKTKSWERVRDAKGNELPYRAGISAFGYSGTNVHMILEEYMESETKGKIIMKEKSEYKHNFDSNKQYIKDHAVEGRHLLAGVMFPAAVIQCVAEEEDAKGIFELKDVQWLQPIEVGSEGVNIGIHLKQCLPTIKYEVSAEHDMVYGKGTLVFGARETQRMFFDDSSVMEECKKRLGKGEFYSRLKESGYQYGEGYMPLEEVSISDRAAVGTLNIPPGWGEFESVCGYVPSILEGGLQIAGYLANQEAPPQHAILPFCIRSLKLYGSMQNVQKVYVCLDENGRSADLKFYRWDGEIIAVIREYMMRPVKNDKKRDTDSKENAYISGMIQIVSEMLAISGEELSISDELSKYHLDSMLLTELSDRIAEHFKMEVSLPELFDMQPLTISALAKWVQQNTGTIEDDKMIADHDRIPIGSENQDGDIAVIGMEGRMPDSENLEEFFNNLLEGKNLITEIPKDRFDWQQYYGNPKTEENKTNSIFGAFMNDVYTFDHEFFHITPKEAEYMDPQQRILLETVWHLLEDAGYRKSALNKSRTGVYLGVSNLEYSDILVKEGIHNAWTMTGNNLAMAANKISYFYDFKGPSETVDTLCSSSLTAIHRAVSDLNGGVCNYAVAGGINVIFSPKLYIGYGNAGMLSKDGRCKTFDKQADGFVRGEGVGLLLLKKLKKAVEDGDHIYGVIKGSAVNHNGKTKSLTVPSSDAQAGLIKETAGSAGIPVETLTYMELHGTGTPIGDSIEIKGLKKAFAKDEDGSYIGRFQKTCFLGAVKTNVGHLEAAAGMAGMIKVLLAMKHGVIPANMNFQECSDEIELKDTPFELVNERKQWGRLKMNGAVIPRRAGVSSFGAGGANAHIILEEWQVNAEERTDEGPWEFHLSAESNEQLMQYAQEVLLYLERTNAHIGDICYTSVIAREPMKIMLKAAVSSKEELLDILSAYIGKGVLPPQEPLQMQRKELKGIKVDFPKYPFQKLQSRVKLPEQKTAALKAKNLICKEIWKKAEITEYDKIGHVREIYLCMAEDSFANELDRQIGKTCSIYRGDGQEELRERKREGKNPEVVIFAAPLSRGYNAQDNIYHMTALLKSILGVWGNTIRKIIYVFRGENNANHIYHQAMYGFFKSAAREYPQLKYQLIEVESGREMKQCIAEITVMLRLPAVYIRYEKGRCQKELGEWEQTGRMEEPGFRDEGVYLITGGMGGIGRRLMSFLITKYHARLIATGRSSDEEIKDRFSSFSRQEQKYIRYMQADVCNREDMQKVIQQIESTYGVLHGVIHLAGLIADGYLLRKTLDQVAQVLKPKTEGTLLLDELTKEKNLDIFLLFSSVSSMLGNAGQTDYAYAGTFLNGFADYRNALTQKGERKGRACSICWPLWEKGGMRVDMKMQESLYQETGIGVLPEEQAMEYLENAREKNGTMILPGDADKIKKVLKIEKTEKIEETKKIEAPRKTENNELYMKTLRRIKELVSETSKIPVNELSESSQFEQYGMDSVMLVSLGGKLEECLGNTVSNTIFFTYPSIREIAKYLTKHHSNELSSYFHMDLEVLETEIKVRVKENMEIPQEDGIAIIGMSGKFPMSDNLDEFWEHLKKGDSCVGEIPKERWDGKEYYSRNKNERMKCCSKWGGFIRGAYEFDAPFFGITPAEVRMMEPTDRLFIQEVWKTLENAGYTPESLGNKTGVFVGAMYRQYAFLAKDPEQQALLLSTSYWQIANRVSYLFDFKGPSMAVDTACASSLTAVHLACESIYNGECRTAIAGGVNLSLIPEKYVGLGQSGMLGSADKSMSLQEGDGYVPGEGVGAVLLKPLSLALKDGDIIYGVIKSTAVNHSGKTVGFCSPDPKAQEELIQDLLRKAAMEIASVNYVEMAANGSKVGDLLEVAALKAAFRGIDMDHTAVPIPVGTVKSNIGHLEAASGMSQLLKVLLQMQHGEIVPFSGDAFNNQLFEGLPLYLNKKLSVWESTDKKRALLYSLGAGGTNAGMLVEEYCNAEREQSQEHWPLFFGFSAKNKKALQTIVRNMRRFLEETENLDYRKLSYTLLTGRRRMEERAGVLAHGSGDLSTKLEQLLEEEKGAEIYRGYVEDGDEEQIKEGAVSVKQLAVLWTHGAIPEIEKMEAYQNCRRIVLPPYPFQKEVYHVSFETEKIQPGNIPDTSGSIKLVIAECTQIPLEELKDQRSLLRYGVDSLGAVRIINRLNEYYGVDINMEEVFDEFTVNRLMRIIEEKTSARQELHMEEKFE